MFKKLLIAIVAVLLMCQMALAKNWNARFYGGDNSITAMVGYDVKPSAEIGGEITYLDLQETPATVGIYAIWKPDMDVNLPNPIPIEGMPKELKAKPFIGISAGWDILERGTYRKFIAGGIIEDVLFLAWERADGDDDFADSGTSGRFVAGAQFKF